ncbi:MAG: succinate dehydrogenase, hydrophobic membrane anchor protein [Devosiaceae bacterium]|nr:succinate dehydrogenase, hydrophobic membrane anchor protein [Devosiaceae bacterium MH13]
MANMRTPLSRVRGLGSAKEGTDHFWRQRVTALANVPLILFFIVMVIGLQGASHAEFVSVMGSPLAAILMLLVIISGTIHMRLGMQVIIEDYIHNELTKILALLGNTFFAIIIAAASIYAILKMSFGG